MTPVTRRDTPAAPPFARLSNGLVALLVAELVVVAFFPALRAGFVSWDDDTYFLNNPYYRGLGPAQLRWMFTVTSGHYMPLTWLTHGLDYVLWGMRPAGYHVMNVVLHALAAAAAYVVALRVLAAAVAPEPLGARRLAAAVAALPLAQREAFLLHQEGGLTAAEIAATTGTNEEAAKSRLRYAMNKLREAIGDD